MQHHSDSDVVIFVFWPAGPMSRVHIWYLSENPSSIGVFCPARASTWKTICMCQHSRNNCWGQVRLSVDRIFSTLSLRMTSFVYRIGSSTVVRLQIVLLKPQITLLFLPSTLSESASLQKLLPLAEDVWFLEHDKWQKRRDKRRSSHFKPSHLWYRSWQHSMSSSVARMADMTAVQVLRSTASLSPSAHVTIQKNVPTKDSTWQYGRLSKDGKRA